MICLLHQKVSTNLKESCLFNKFTYVYFISYCFSVCLEMSYWRLFTDSHCSVNHWLVCTQELLEHYLRCEYNHLCPHDKPGFMESCHEVLVECRDGRQLMIFVENLESMVSLCIILTAVLIIRCILIVWLFALFISEYRFCPFVSIYLFRMGSQLVPRIAAAVVTIKALDRNQPLS